VRNPWPWIAVATAGFAGGTILGKLTLDAGMDPLTLTGIRLIIAAVGLGAVLAVGGRLVTNHDWRRGSILGVVNMALPPLFLTLALASLTASLSGLVVALIPGVSVVAAHFLVPGERFRAWRIPGLVVAVVGVTILLGGATDVDSGSMAAAIGWSALGVTAAGTGGALSRRFALEVPTKRLVVPQFVTAAITASVVCTVLGAWSTLSDSTPTALWWAAATGIFGTIVPFVSFLEAVERAETARASLIGYLVPMVSAVGAVVFLGDPVSSSLVVGGSVVLVGVLLADRGRILVDRIRPPQSFPDPQAVSVPSAPE